MLKKLRHSEYFQQIEMKIREGIRKRLLGTCAINTTRHAYNI